MMGITPSDKLLLKNRVVMSSVFLNFFNLILNTFSLPEDAMDRLHNIQNQTACKINLKNI